MFEDIAMREVKSNPLVDSFEVPVEMTDVRWRKEDGWVKKQRTFKTRDSVINIHFNYNTKTGEFDDFKFKDN